MTSYSDKEARWWKIIEDARLPTPTTMEEHLEWFIKLNAYLDDYGIKKDDDQ